MQPTDPSLSAKSIFLTATACGLVFGLLEGIEASVFRAFPAIWPEAKVSLDVLWLAPPAYVGAFLLMACMILPFREWLGKSRLPYLAGSFSLIGFSSLYKYPRLISGYAWMTLAMGSAVMASRGLARRAAGLPRLFTQAIVTCTVMICLAFLGTTGYRELQFQSGIRSPLKCTQCPNVLIVIADTMRADGLSSYGSSRLTPSLDRLATEGTLYERAYAASSWSLPSHASLFTAMLPSVHKADWKQPAVPRDIAFLPEVFASQGYATAAFSANHVWFTPEHGFGRGFQTYETYDPVTILERLSFGRNIVSLWEKLGFDRHPHRSAEQMAGKLLHWVDRVQGKPFFAVLNVMDVHEPYATPQSPPQQYRIWRHRGQWTEEESAFLVKSYYEAAVYVDAQIGSLVEELRARGVLDNTALIITSDHGESLSYFDHGEDLRLDSIHVPLIIRFPGRVPAGVRLSDPVSLMNIPRTVLSLAQVDAGNSFAGHSLTDVEAVQAASRDQLVVSQLTDKKGQMISESYISPDWQLIRHPQNGREEFFLLCGMAECKDQAGNPNAATLLEEARKQVATVRKADKDSPRSK